MKCVANNYSDSHSDIEYGFGGESSGLSLESLGSELRALYDDITGSETPRDLVELAEKVETLAAKAVTEA